MSENNDDTCETCKFPSIAQQAKNLSKSIADTVANAAKLKGVKASKEEIDRRLEICRDCPYFKENRCTQCGCFISFKAALKHEKCPKGKW